MNKVNQKKYYTNACMVPPGPVLESGNVRVDVGVVFPIVSIGLFFTLMVVFVSEINGGLSSFVQYSILFVGSITIIVMIVYNQYRTFTSYDELRKA